MKKYLLLILILGITGCTSPNYFGGEKINKLDKVEIEKEYQKSAKIKDKYKLEKSAFIKEAKTKNDIQVEIGDKTKDIFEPEMNISRWNNEVSLKLKPKVKNSQDIFGATEDISEVSLDEEKIVYSGGDIEYHYYDIEPNEEHPEGAYEFEVILKEKPATNIVEFDLDTKGLDFFYQPEIEDSEVLENTKEKLTAEQILEKKREMRPENVVGSYAVYASEQKNNYVGGKEYKTGKVGHIYRPQIEDADGNKVWGELNVDTKKGILSVEIPQDFLDNAVYPVKHAAGLTFGYDTYGGSQVSSGSEEMVGSLFTSPSDTSVADNIIVNGRSTGGTRYGKGVLVLHSNLNIVSNGIGAEVGFPEYKRDWYTSTFSTQPTLSPSTEYVLMGIFDPYIYLRYDTGNTDQGHKDTSNNYATPENPTSNTHSTNLLSIYATYTASESDTCTYSGSGDWNVNYSDNCVATTTTYVLGDLNLNYDGAGSFSVRALLQVNDLNVGNGADIDFENSSAQLEIY